MTKAKNRYELQAKYKDSNTWNTYRYFDDLNKAKEYQQMCRVNNPRPADRRI